jgi:hypothetical protein
MNLFNDSNSLDLPSKTSVTVAAFSSDIKLALTATGV